AELHAGHDPDCLGQRSDRTIVEIRRCHRDVTQARNPEDIEILGILGHVETTFVDGLAARRLPVIFDDPEFAVGAATYPDALVAGSATGIDELCEPGARH